MNRCLVCDEPTDEESEICRSCQENFMQQDEEEEADIGKATNAKLTAGFRMLKGQGE
jgi:hypothetical protein